ncbi:MAG TPA: hypothetical protein VJI97_04510 [Candidatus Nanoarchaeia archaeon]|nr:hypothetical protein [Candidatus Nanoarchaeia archaeon]
MSKASYRGPIVARDDYIPNGSTQAGPGAPLSGAVPLDGIESKVVTNKRTTNSGSYRAIGYGSYSGNIRY